MSNRTPPADRASTASASDDLPPGVANTENERIEPECLALAHRAQLAAFGR